MMKTEEKLIIRTEEIEELLKKMKKYKEYELELIDYHDNAGEWKELLVKTLKEVV